ncbi:hypothetical protein PJP10_32610, partial [Mycobacterium kansasii]
MFSFSMSNTINLVMKEIQLHLIDIGIVKYQMMDRYLSNWHIDKHMSSQHSHQITKRNVTVIRMESEL